MKFRPMRRPHRLVFTLLAALGAGALLAQPPAPSAAPPGAPAREAELERIRGEIARLQARLEQVKAAATGIAGQLERTQVELQLQEEKVDEAVAARDLADRAVAESEHRVADLEARVERTRGELRESLVDLYRLGRHGYLRLFLSLKPDQGVLPGIRLLRFVARRDSEILERYREAQTQLGFERDQLETERRDKQAWVERESERRLDLVTLRERERDLLAQAESEQQRISQRTSELQDKEKKLSDFLDLLYGRNPAIQGKPLADFRGVLDWPLRGRVVRGFGPRLDPRYGTKVPHNGIDILPAEAGDEVRAVYPGKVLFAAPFEGFGVTVVVHHAGRGFTLYGGLAAARVSKDDVLSLGAPVGSAGDLVYFEIRVENHPEDPLTWLREAPQ